MARNSELIRQWEILRAIDAARNGIPVPKLAAAQDVHQRTIRRDIEALSKAGFPLYDEQVNGTTMWKLRAKPFRGLEETGLGVTELCGLYFSRSIMKALAGAPFQDELERAFMKLERALPVASRKFLDRFPSILKAKVTGRKKQDEKKVREFIARAIDASLRQRRLDALRLRVFAPNQGVQGGSASPVVRGWRHLPDRLGRGIQPGANVFSRTHPRPRCPGRAFRASGPADRAFSPLDGRALWHARFRFNRVRRARRGLRQGSRLARVAGVRRAPGWVTADDADRLRRLGRCAAGSTASGRSPGSSPRLAWPRRSSRRSMKRAIATCRD